MVLFRSRRRSGGRSWLALAAVLASFTGIQEGLGGTPANAAGILFLDRCVANCVYHQGFDSSINNTSSIIGGTRILTPFDHGDAAWAEHLACVQATFAPSDITVTDVDPGAVARLGARGHALRAVPEVNPGFGGEFAKPTAVRVGEDGLLYGGVETFRPAQAIGL